MIDYKIKVVPGKHWLCLWL